MKQIRHGVFETNSSSVHTIAIPCERFNSDVHVPDSVTLCDESYGWGFSVLEDFTDKVKYMYEVAKKYNETKKDVEKILSDPHGKEKYSWYYNWHASLKFKYDDYVKRYIDILHELGVNDVEIIYDDFDYWGGIDHGENWCGELDDFFDDVELMKHFLFNDKAYIVTGNDNNDYFIENMQVAKTHKYPVDTYYKTN